MYRIKKHLLNLFLFSIASIATLSLSNFKTVDEEKFTVDTRKSSVEWKATKVGGEHHGSIKLNSGLLLMKENLLQGGSFTVDMNTITVAELKGSSKENLLNHLRSDDFFGVADNPKSTFQITSVSPSGADKVNITGNLTIKGISRPVSFPATVRRQNDVVTATASGIKVNRTRYDIKYRSLSFFSDIADKAIDDEFEISVNLWAKK